MGEEKTLYRYLRLWAREKKYLLIFLAQTILFYFFKDYIYLLLEREEGREKERERNINGWERHLASYMPPTPQLCPDWELNR